MHWHILIIITLTIFIVIVTIFTLILNHLAFLLIHRSSTRAASLWLGVPH
jgi:hypothetical protein